MAQTICPRCERPLEKLTGTSRTDNTTLICTECETAESIQDWLEGAPLAQDKWPVV